MKETTIEVKVIEEDDGKAKVMIGIDENDPPSFIVLMCAAEYLLAVVAMESNAGFEKALELIVQGAMTYRHELKPEKPQ